MRPSSRMPSGSMWSADNRRVRVRLEEQMKSRCSMLALAAIFAVPCPAQLSPKESFVVTEKEAFGLMPASLVAAPTVRQLEWSPDGQYVLATRESLRLKAEDVK